jgi:hypothetical protein
MHRPLIALFAATTLLMATGALPAPAGAATAPGAWPTWTMTPEDPAARDHQGTIAFGLPGMPDATFTVTKTVDDGESTRLRPNDEEYIAAGTPMGAVFGGSGPSTSTQFLQTRVSTPDDSVATITVTFASAVPAGLLGFAVNDVDVDQLVIGGTQPGGSTLSGGQLQGAAFNLCDTADAPPSCEGVVAPFDLPTWDPATRTLTGSDDDTDGAAAWFQPSVPVSSLTFEFSGLEGSGAPSFRLWLAARQASVGGQIAFADGSTPTPVTLELVGPGGDVVATTTSGSDGTYAFGPVLADAGYTVRLVVPDGYAADGPTSVEVDLRDGDARVDFTLSAAADAGAGADPIPVPAAPRFTG